MVFTGPLAPAPKVLLLMPYQLFRALVWRNIVTASSMRLV